MNCQTLRQQFALLGLSVKKDFEGLSIETIRTALGFIDPEDSEQWIRVGMALYSELGEQGFDPWNA